LSIAWFVDDIMMPFTSFTWAFYLMTKNYSLSNAIMFGLPWTIYLIFNTTCICRSITLLVSHFHIICYFHCLKLEMVNNYLNTQLKKDKLLTHTKIMALMRRYDSNFIEIANHNDDFWSKYLLSVFFIYVALIGTLLYQSLFGSAPIVIRFLVTYLCLLNIAILSTCNLSAASVVSSQKGSYKFLNLCFIKYQTNNKAFKLKVR